MSSRPVVPAIMAALAALLASPMPGVATEPRPDGSLPAALAHLGITAGDIVSDAEAQQIRGQAWGSNGAGVVARIVGAVQVDGSYFAVDATVGGQAITLAVGSNGVQAAAEGIAYPDVPPSVQGVFLGRIGPSDWMVAFQGGATAATVIALPGLFAVDLR